MLIKYYNVNGDLFIIENIQDIEVPAGNISYNYLSPEENDAPKTYFFEKDTNKNCKGLPDNSEKWFAREILYAKDGACRLIVCGNAYICNDDGKTIEKVSALA